MIKLKNLLNVIKYLSKRYLSIVGGSQTFLKCKKIIFVNKKKLLLLIQKKRELLFLQVLVRIRIVRIRIVEFMINMLFANVGQL